MSVDFSRCEFLKLPESVNDFRKSAWAQYETSKAWVVKTCGPTCEQVNTMGVKAFNVVKDAFDGVDALVGLRDALKYKKIASFDMQKYLPYGVMVSSAASFVTSTKEALNGEKGKGITGALSSGMNFVKAVSEVNISGVVKSAAAQVSARVAPYIPAQVTVLASHASAAIVSPLYGPTSGALAAASKVFGAQDVMTRTTTTNAGRMCEIASTTLAIAAAVFAYVGVAAAKMERKDLAVAAGIFSAGLVVAYCGLDMVQKYLCVPSLEQKLKQLEINELLVIQQLKDEEANCTAAQSRLEAAKQKLALAKDAVKVLENSTDEAARTTAIKNEAEAQTEVEAAGVAYAPFDKTLKARTDIEAEIVAVKESIEAAKIEAAKKSEAAAAPAKTEGSKSDGADAKSEGVA